MNIHPLCHGVSFYPSFSFSVPEKSRKVSMNLRLCHTKHLLAHVTYVISYMLTVNSIKGCDVFACTLLHLQVHNTCQYMYNLDK